MKMNLFLIILSIFCNTQLANSKIENKSKDALIPSRFSANFEQSFISSLSGKDKSSSGVIKYLYPGHLWFEVTKPEKDRTLFISNAKKSWFYTPPFDENEKGEVVIQSANKLLLASVFDSLKSGLIDNNIYTVKDGEIEPKEVNKEDKNNNIKKVVEIIFKSKPSSEMGVIKAFLKFKSNSLGALKDLFSITLFYTDGRKVTLSLSNLKEEDQEVNKDDFVFKFMDKVRVVERK